jgi:hypothetical protein
VLSVLCVCGELSITFLALPGKDGQSLLTIIGLEDLTALAPAPRGTPLWRTSYRNFAPRVGAAYELLQSRQWQTVLRGGAGIFYDLGSGTVAEAAALFPYYRTRFASSSNGIPYPLNPSLVAPPPFSLEPPFGSVGVLDPNINLPRVYQLSAAVEQAIGVDQTLSVTYVGALGRRLLRRERLLVLNPDFQDISITGITLLPLITRFSCSFSAGFQMAFRLWFPTPGHIP